MGQILVWKHDDHQAHTMCHTLVKGSGGYEPEISLHNGVENMSIIYVFVYNTTSGEVSMGYDM